MKTLKQGSVVSQKDGNRFAVTQIVDDKRFFAIWIGNKDFTDRVTFNGFVRNGDFRSDNILFLRTKNGVRRIKSIGGVLGLMNSQDSRDTFDLLESLKTK